MPRIDPLALLNCLGVLLGPDGGIKGTKEVDRLVTLMTKFSKKLVSKCIYVQILKTTDTELLNQFMSTGGWDLIHIWLTDAIVAKNTALIQELLELLLLCPVDIARLKSNNNPKLIKGLSKEGSLQSIRQLACQLVDQWLKIVKDSVPSESQQAATMPPNHVAPTVVQHKVEPENPIQTEESLHTISPMATNPPSTVSVQDLVPSISPLELPSHQQFHDKIHIQPVQLQIVNKTLPGQSQPTQIKKQSFVVVSNTTTPPSVPVYKITIRDGKQVLTKVETDAANITKNLFNDSNKGQVVKDEVKPKDELKTEIDDVDSRRESESAAGANQQVTPATETSALDVKEAGKDGSEVKSSDKENRDSAKKDDKSKDDKKSHHKSSSKSSSSSRHSSSKSSSSSRSSSHKSSSSSRSGSSSKSSSRDKDRHHSSSRHSSSSKSRSEREKEKEKERLKKDQAEKDKATLEKVQGQAINAKIGKIPKKKSEDDKPTDTSSIRKSSTDSRDSSKENKTDAKKAVAAAPVILEKKNISISIENRKNSQESSRPKTVKTFNSKFRSTGLEEEVKPPPSRAGSKKPPPSPAAGSDAKKIIVPPKISLKRASPLRETAIADKRAKLSLEPPVINAGDDKKGAIKLIAPKPKPMVLQESDMFMDALTASTKNEKPRKRKRRNSLSKDGTETKRLDSSFEGSKESSPTPQSPPGADERSPIAIKPEFKFYQDTLEINEDKEQSTNDKSPEIESPEPKDRSENMEDDEGSRTPTGEEEVDELKPPASPDNEDDAGKTPASPNSEIRYVDGLRSVLIMQKRKGPKKSLKWKEDLESIRYFELDETERVNVTKTFTDMKQMEKQGEREAFQMARKLSTEDLMEERTRWKPLIPIDMPPPLVEPGKDSKEREIQYAREKGILQALYFNRSMIPDSPSEPDEERHHGITDPKIIPLDDLTGNRESEKDFTSVPWPEPKPQLTPTPPAASVFTSAFTHNPVAGIAPTPQMVMNPPMAPMIPLNHVEVTGGGGGWRTGDGKVVVPDVNIASINNMGFPPPNMMPPPSMFNHAQPSDAGFPGMPPMDDGNFPMPNNFQGPAMFGPGPNFQGPPPPRGGMHGNRGRGGPGWFRGGPGPIRGGAGWANRGAWRGGKQPPVCRQFTKNGFCRVGDKCQYLHPGVNCPPF